MNQREERQSPTNRGATILVVEDDEMVRRLVSRTLQKAGYVILEAVDGQNALDIANQHAGRIDLVLSDVVMPSMSGPALVAQMRASGLQAPVLFMSGYTADHAVLAAALDASTSLIEKPFTPAALLRKIGEILAPRTP